MKVFKVAIVAALTAIAEAGVQDFPIKFQPIAGVTSDSLHNIHIQYGMKAFEGPLEIIYGACNLKHPRQQHHSLGRAEISSASLPTRLVWVVPEDAQSEGCLHAFSGENLVGRSQPIIVRSPLRRRQSIADVADIDGPWFDGVAYMKSKHHSDAFVTEAKNKTVAIIGGGMAGLMTSLLLQSVGITNWEIIESSSRIGGRVRTMYLNGTGRDDYQYQEMGPMRFPVSIKYPGKESLEIQDHKMVFQLAETLNRMNGNKSDLLVKFYPWIQESPNMPSPGFDNVAAGPPNATEADIATKGLADFLGLTEEKLSAAATNIYQAHKQALKDGLLDFSEANYLRYMLGLSLNTTNYLAGSSNTGMFAEVYDGVYFMADKWVTIERGLESLPRAFGPHIKDKIVYNRKVSGLTYNNATRKVAVNWRDKADRFSLKPKSQEFDFAIVSAPFTKVRLWKTPPYPSVLSRAINNFDYGNACKVALHYKTRFWEHLNPPIIGGCSYAGLPGIQSFCYPSYGINRTGPGVLLATYTYEGISNSVQALSDEDHVALAQRAMIEAHGDVAAEQFTGIYERKCWGVDEHQAGAWASPAVGQQKLFLPSFFQTEFKTIFIGEHTSYTHEWIFSALDSAVRGSVQLCLELGLVDEAKQIVKEWMGRWIRL